jgi:hypothetical protein
MEENLHEIDILTEEYPYYSFLYFKRAKLLADSKNEAYKNALKLASIYAPNRRKLQEFIENPTDYRKEMVIHPEWLSEDTENNTENSVLNMNDEELIKEILTIEEPQQSVPIIEETPIVNEVYEIEEILSHITEENTAVNTTMQEIEQLKLTIQQNQEKARLALFQSDYKDKEKTTDVTTLLPKEETTTIEKADTAHEIAFFTEEVPAIQEDIKEKTEEITEITNKTSVSDTQEKVIKDSSETETQQEPVSLNVPKIKEWFEKELKAVRSEKEEKENQNIQLEEQINIEKEEKTITPEVSETENTQISAEGYMSWLDELLGMQKDTQKTTETQKTGTDKKAIQDSIIDKFLQNQPKINKPNLTETPVTEDKAESQSVEYEDIASETLAKIFVMQKQYDRAIRIYQVLISKNPSQKEQYEEIIKDIQQKMN